jgi:DNA-binding PadR family transcriptional regulator
MSQELPLSERVLQMLHNLCATSPELARRVEELAQVLHVDAGELERILDDYKRQGFAESYTDNEGKKKYYLTGSGIIKICAIFT